MENREGWFRTFSFGGWRIFIMLGNMIIRKGIKDFDRFAKIWMKATGHLFWTTLNVGGGDASDLKGKGLIDRL